jgi:hypothetical protein
VALEGEALHVLARAAPLLRDHLGGAELRDLLRAVAREPALRRRERIREAVRLAGQHRRRDGDEAHALYAAGDDQVAGAAQHRLRREVRGLLRRAALAVDRRAGHLVGETRRQPAGASDVAGLGPDRVDAAEDDVLDGVRIDARARDERREHVRAEIGRMHQAQAALLPPDRRPHGIDDVRFSHLDLR